MGAKGQLGDRSVKDQADFQRELKKKIVKFRKVFLYKKKKTMSDKFRRVASKKKCLKYLVGTILIVISINN